MRSYPAAFALGAWPLPVRPRIKISDNKQKKRGLGRVSRGVRNFGDSGVFAGRVNAGKCELTALIFYIQMTKSARLIKSKLLMDRGGVHNLVPGFSSRPR